MAFVEFAAVESTTVSPHPAISCLWLAFFPFFLRQAFEEVEGSDGKRRTLSSHHFEKVRKSAIPRRARCRPEFN
jgi:hypothetical protein